METQSVRGVRLDCSPPHRSTSTMDLDHLDIRTFGQQVLLSNASNSDSKDNVSVKIQASNSNPMLEGGSSFDLLISAKMTVRALYFFVLGFSGLFAIQVISGVI